MKRSAGRPERPIDDNAPFRDFATQLRETRRCASLTLRELSARTGYSTGWLSEVEAGVKLPSLEWTLAFATACGADSEAWAARWRAVGRAGAVRPTVRNAAQGSGPAHAVATSDLTSPGAPSWTGREAGEREREQGQKKQVLTRHSSTENHGTARGIINFAVVDDHPIILEMFSMRFGSAENDIQVIGTAATVDGLLEGPGRAADVVLLDLDLGDGTTVEGNVAAIIAAGPAVLILSASDRPSAVRAAMRAGARGYILKNEPFSDIEAAIREAAAGRDWVSPRLAYIFAADNDPDRPALSHQEKRVLQLYATGFPMKSVAKKMGISEETVKQYLARVRQKYTIAGRATPTKLDLYHRAVEDGHLPPPS